MKKKNRRRVNQVRKNYANPQSDEEDDYQFGGWNRISANSKNIKKVRQRKALKIKGAKKYMRY